MIPNCLGCKTEFEMAFEQVRRGYNLATTKERCGIGEKKHFFILIVDNKGSAVVG